MMDEPVHGSHGHAPVREHFFPRRELTSGRLRDPEQIQRLTGPIPSSTSLALMIIDATSTMDTRLFVAWRRMWS